MYAEVVQDIITNATCKLMRKPAIPCLMSHEIKIGSFYFLFIPNFNIELFIMFAEFPQALVKLLKNPVYMLANLASVFEMMIVTGFLTFIPKYLETQFDLRTSEANLYTGL